MFTDWGSDEEEMMVKGGGYDSEKSCCQRGRWTDIS